MKELLITTNSPGEVSGWLRPTLEALIASEPDLRVYIALPPCPYASGQEGAVLREFPGVAGVLNPREVIRLLLFGQWPPHLGRPKPEAVLFLGGDMLWAGLLGRRLGVPALAYTQTKAVGARFFRYFCVPDERRQKRLLQQGIPQAKVAVIGDLMAAAVKPRLTPSEAARLCRINPTAGPVVAIFPGSRPYQLELMLTFFLTVAAGLQTGIPGLQVIFSIAPFVTRATLEAALKSVDPAVGGTTGELISRDGGWWFCTNAGEYPVVGFGQKGQALQYEVMQVADLALSMPGTNTMELAVLQVPMLVVALLTQMEKIPLDGLFGTFERVPLLGKWGKRLLVERVSKRTPFLALPNMETGQQIVPELRGIFPPQVVVEEALALLKDLTRLEGIKAALLPFRRDQKAAKHLAKLILSLGSN